jgi:hypothetical protein
MQCQVLTDGEKYWTYHWELFNNSPRKPRHRMGPLEEAVLCFGPEAIEVESRLAWEILRVLVFPVPVQIHGQGKNSVVALGEGQ